MTLIKANPFNQLSKHFGRIFWFFVLEFVWVSYSLKFFNFSAATIVNGFAAIILIFLTYILAVGWIEKKYSTNAALDFALATFLISAAFWITTFVSIYSF